MQVCWKLICMVGVLDHFLLGLSSSLSPLSNWSNTNQVSLTELTFDSLSWFVLTLIPCWGWRLCNIVLNLCINYLWNSACNELNWWETNATPLKQYTISLFSRFEQVPSHLKIRIITQCNSLRAYETIQDILQSSDINLSSHEWLIVYGFTSFWTVMVKSAQGVHKVAYCQTWSTII